MELSGVNKKCKRCTEDCKQYEQVTIQVCPNFKPIDKKVSNMK